MYISAVCRAPRLTMSPPSVLKKCSRKWKRSSHRLVAKMHQAAYQISKISPESRSHRLCQCRIQGAQYGHGPQSGHAPPIQSESLAINFVFKGPTSKGIGGGEEKKGEGKGEYREVRGRERRVGRVTGLLTSCMSTNSDK